LEVFEPVGLLESIKVERQVDEPDFPTIWDLKIRILDPSLLPFAKISSSALSESTSPTMKKQDQVPFLSASLARM
jgi:hypothetical protein